MDESTVGVAASALPFGSCSVFPSINASTDAAHSFSECDENAAEVECESPQTEPDCVLELQRRIELLETRLADCQEKLSEAEKENAVLSERQFSIDKIKDDNAAVLFYTGFLSYEALISFYKYIEPKLSKMQYWKGENLVKESQPYQLDDNKSKPGPSRKLTFLDEFLLVLMRLKGLFVQDLADRFGISASLVSRICMTWINLLYHELKDLFPLGGRVSDKQITRESGVLDLLQVGDNVMVDHGFDISAIVPAGVTVNMPPFLAGHDQMTAAETEETMSIASVRIHVERAIGRIKTYHILDGTLPNTLSPYATQISTVCGLLTNFLPPLLPPANL